MWGPIPGFLDIHARRAVHSIRKKHPALLARPIHVDVCPNFPVRTRCLDEVGGFAEPGKGKGLVLAPEAVGVILAHCFYLAGDVKTLRSEYMSQDGLVRNSGVVFGPRLWLRGYDELALYVASAVEYAVKGVSDGYWY